MSILIKGAKMPTNCRECAGARPTFNGVYCWVISLPIHDLSCRHPDCPLVEIPPHGRLIDANKLCEYARNITVVIDANDICRFPCVIEAEEQENE